MVLRIGVPYDARSSAYTSFDGKYRYVLTSSPHPYHPRVY
jgi:hypothetical protein